MVFIDRWTEEEVQEIVVIAKEFVADDRMYDDWEDTIASIVKSTIPHPQNIEVRDTLAYAELAMKKRHEA